MALITCGKCSRVTSDEASNCPNCNTPIVKTDRWEELLRHPALNNPIGNMLAGVLFVLAVPVAVMWNVTFGLVLHLFREERRKHGVSHRQQFNERQAKKKEARVKESPEALSEEEERPDGPYKKYDEFGRLQEKGVYRDGKRYGPTESYYYKSYWEGETKWYCDLKTTTDWELSPYGQFEKYHRNGQLKYKYNDTEDHGRDGPFEEYFSDGRLRGKGVYSGGRKCGEWIEEGKTVTYDPCPPDLADGN